MLYRELISSILCQYLNYHNKELRIVNSRLESQVNPLQRSWYRSNDNWQLMLPYRRFIKMLRDPPTNWQSPPRHMTEERIGFPSRSVPKIPRGRECVCRRTLRQPDGQSDRRTDATRQHEAGGRLFIRNSDRVFARRFRDVKNYLAKCSGTSAWWQRWVVLL